MLVLGLDPGSVHTGWGVVEKRGSRHLARGWGRLSCPRGESVPRRLHRLGRGLGELLEQARPDLLVVESPYYGLNAKSLITLSQARGALLACAAGHDGLEIVEYSPAEIKATVTGNGRAGKNQVTRVVRMLLSLADEDLSEDAGDALAAALCGVQRHRLDRLGREVSRASARGRRARRGPGGEVAG